MILEPFGEFVDVLGRPARYFHAEMEAHLGEHFLDLVERLAAEIRGSQHFALGLLNEVANVDYIVVLETVCRTHRELKLVNFLEEGRVEGKIRNGLGDADFLAGFLEIDEHIALVLENARRKSQRNFRGNRSIGLDLHGQLVVVENLSLTGVLHPIGHLLDRRIQAVDRDQPDRCILRPIALRRHIALAGIDSKFHADLGALVEMIQHQLRIENHDVADGLDVARGDKRRASLLHDHALRAVALHLDGNVFDVKDDVGHVLAHAGDGRKFVEDAVDVHRLHARPLQRGQQNTPQRVAERQSKAALERLSHHGRGAFGIGPQRHVQLVRSYQFLPVLLDCHLWSPSRSAACTGRRNQRCFMGKFSTARGTPAEQNYTRRRLRGRQPLCGIGVTSRIEVMVKPAACKARSADSRPDPGPATSTSRVRMPCSWALRATSSPATWAAYGVDLREPLKPIVPADDQAIALPWASVIVIIVLLNDAFTWATPDAMFLRSRRRTRTASLPILNPFATRYSGSHLIPCNLLLLACDRLGRTLAGSSVGVGALAANRKAAPMPQTPIATEIHEPFDVHRRLASQIAFDKIIAIDHFADLQNLLVGKLGHPPRIRNPHLCYDLTGLRGPNAVNVLEPDQDPLVGRNVNTSDTGQGRHSCCRLLCRPFDSAFRSAAPSASTPPPAWQGGSGRTPPTR